MSEVIRRCMNCRHPPKRRKYGMYGMLSLEAIQDALGHRDQLI